MKIAIQASITSRIAAVLSITIRLFLMVFVVCFSSFFPSVQLHKLVRNPAFFQRIQLIQLVLKNRRTLVLNQSDFIKHPLPFLINQNF